MAVIYRIKKTCTTVEERRQGMMNDYLEPDECCVFVYESDAYRSFWGKDTPQDLFVSLVCDGVVVESRRIYAYDERPVKLKKHIGSICIETLDRLYVGQHVTFTGASIMVV